jgi:hypothetical protein
VFCQEADIPFEENHHFRRKQKNSMVVDLFMHVESPAEYPVAYQQAAYCQHSFFHKMV